MSVIHYESIDKTINDMILNKITSEETKNSYKEQLCNDEKRNILSRIIGVDSLSIEEVETLVGPWCRAKLLGDWWIQFDWESSKVKAGDYVDLISQLEKKLKIDQGEVNLLMSVLISSYLDTDNLLLQLGELKEFYNILPQLNLGKGNKYTKDCFMKHAVNSLFYMIYSIGTQRRSSKNNPINSFVLAITGRDPATIRDDHYSYKNIDYLNKFETDRNIPIQFIFNPKCKTTFHILRKIRLRRILKNI